MRSERSELRLRAVLAEAQEAVRGWEVAEDGIEELERQLGLLRARVAATEAELAASRVRVVNQPAKTAVVATPRSPCRYS